MQAKLFENFLHITTNSSFFEIPDDGKQNIWCKNNSVFFNYKQFEQIETGELSFSNILEKINFFLNVYDLKVSQHDKSSNHIIVSNLKNKVIFDIKSTSFLELLNSLLSQLKLRNLNLDLKEKLDGYYNNVSTFHPASFENSNNNVFDISMLNASVRKTYLFYFFDLMRFGLKDLYVLRNNEYVKIDKINLNSNITLDIEGKEISLKSVGITGDYNSFIVVDKGSTAPSLENDIANTKTINKKNESIKTPTF